MKLLHGQQSAETLRAYYGRMRERLQAARQKFQRPLSLAEKIIFTHLESPNFTDEDGAEIIRGSSFINLRVSHVAMQDATAQMALHQFAHLGKPVQVPSTVHLDHLIQASRGVHIDLPLAMSANGEVYDFLKSAGERYGIGYWGPGSGIIHQVVAENYAFPGGVIIGTDSHTVNAGGMGMFAVGVGGTDAVDGMAGLPFNVLMPKLIGVKLRGSLSGWSSAKDVIIKLLQILTVDGGTNAVVEYFGEGVDSIAATGRMTAANMGAEHGATASLFGFDSRTAAYLSATGRGDWAEVAEEFPDMLAADPEVAEKPAAIFDAVYEIDLTTLWPHVSGPHSPDKVRSLEELKNAELEIGEISQALIGSCTNSSYQDMVRAAFVLKSGLDAGLKLKVPLSINCGSRTIYDTINAAGVLRVFERAGAVVMANACGGCIGQWKRTDELAGKPNVIVSSFNRNFPGRNDESKLTQSFLMSPEMVAAYAFAGTLRCNPLIDAIPGTSVYLSEPAGEALPVGGLSMSREGYVDPPEMLMQTQIVIRPDSERLAHLEPFAPWDGADIERAPVLVFANGKCTTDHISPPGKWLRFRGNLREIARNTYLGVTNPFTGKDNDALNIFTGDRGTYYDVAKAYQAQGLGWVVLGDNNLGEGSSREHAALQPRWLGCRAVIIRGRFARIHETNLKKQGVLPLRFVNDADRGIAVEGTCVSIHGLASLAPGKNLALTLHQPDGTEHHCEVSHSMSERQIEWFKAGSCLNYLKSN